MRWKQRFSEICEADSVQMLSGPAFGIRFHFSDPPLEGPRWIGPLRLTQVSAQMSTGRSLLVNIPEHRFPAPRVRASSVHMSTRLQRWGMAAPRASESEGLAWMPTTCGRIGASPESGRTLSKSPNSGPSATPSATPIALTDPPACLGRACCEPPCRCRRSWVRISGLRQEEGGRVEEGQGRAQGAGDRGGPRRHPCPRGGRRWRG